MHVHDGAHVPLAAGQLTGGNAAATQLVGDVVVAA